MTTAPDAVKTQFDRARDQEQAVELLRAGCAHMRNDAAGQPGKALLEALRFPDCQRS